MIDIGNCSRYLKLLREKKESNNSYVPHSRVGKKAITGFFEPEVNKELKMLGLEQDASNQDLVKISF